MAAIPPAQTTTEPKTGLKDKVAEKAGTAVTKDVATVSPATGLVTQLNKMMGQIAKALPKHMDAERMVRVATTAIRLNPTLGNCTPQSFFGAMLNASALGLEPSLIGHAYLVPFKNNKKGGVLECQLIIGYKGMLDLVRRSGEVIGTPKARIVYANDLFDLEYGLKDDKFRHVPWYMRKDETFSDGGEILGAYVHLRYKTGDADVWFIPMIEIEERRRRSKATDDGPWKTDTKAMILKTAIRAFWSYMPVSIEIAERVSLADGNVSSIDTSTLEVMTHTEDGDVIDVTPVDDVSAAA